MGDLSVVQRRDLFWKDGGWGEGADVDVEDCVLLCFRNGAGPQCGATVRPLSEWVGREGKWIGVFSD